MEQKVDVLAVMSDAASDMPSHEAEERLMEARAAVAELIGLVHEARAKYIPRPTSINTKRLATQVEFNERLDALLDRIGSLP